MTMTITQVPFSLGQTVQTRNAMASLVMLDVLAAMSRHAGCDWGDVSDSDWKANDWSIKNGERVLSAYKDSAGVKFWIITERDRSVSTVLLPEDY